MSERHIRREQRELLWWCCSREARNEEITVVALAENHRRWTGADRIDESNARQRLLGLERRGFAVAAIIPSVTRGRPRKVFRLTPYGRDVLKAEIVDLAASQAKGSKPRRCA